MSSNFLTFWIAYLLTGNPLVAGLVVLALWVFADFQTTGVVRRAARALRDWARSSKLSRAIDLNPHDRKARIDLGEILVRQRRFERAAEVLKPALEADPEDAAGLFWMGRACLGMARFEEAELFLDTVAQTAAGSLPGQALLEMGRSRLERRDSHGAAELLGRYLGGSAHSVQGRVLLSRALALQGDSSGAARERDRAWNEYRTSPAYQRRAERLWAWRARPLRPIAYAALAAAGLALVGSALSRADLGRPPDVAQSPSNDRP